MKTGKILLSVPATHTTKNANHKRELFINDLAKHFNWTAGAEIGVRTGRTSFCLLDNNSQLTMYAVDMDISQFYTPLAQQKYSNRLIALEGISWELADKVADNSLDFVFVDAGHGYKSVVRDIEAWKPKLKSTGWLIGHDINFPAVNRAVTEKLKTFKVGPDNVWFLAPTDDYTMLEKI
jgi:predicted O-methyltransferase YrrM